MLVNKSRIYKNLEILSKKDQKTFKKFVEAPFFNQRKDLRKLLDALLKNISTPQKSFTKAIVFQKVFPNEKYDLQRLKLLMSYLNKLFEQFLKVDTFLKDDDYQRQALVKAYRERHWLPEFEKALDKAFLDLNQQSNRNSDYWSRLNELNRSRYTLDSLKHSKDLDIHALSNTSDVHYFANKLRQATLALAHQSVYSGAPFQSLFLSQIIEKCTTPPFKDIAVIQIYYQCYLMLSNPDREEYFVQFKALLFDVSHKFPAPEVRDLNLLAINFCIRQINIGGWDERYFKEIFELYKEGLNKEYLLENGQLSRFTYHNVVAAALKIQDFEWVEWFIETFKKSLEKKYRDSSYSFSLAKLQYTRGDFDAALLLLQRSNYRDVFLNLSARAITLKIFYELDEWDLLDAHLNATKHYIRRKGVTGYHRLIFENLIRYTQKLISVNTFNKASVFALKNAILEEKDLMERDWLMERISDL